MYLANYTRTSDPTIGEIHSWRNEADDYQLGPNEIEVTEAQFGDSTLVIDLSDTTPAVIEGNTPTEQARQDYETAKGNNNVRGMVEAIRQLVENQ